MTQVREAAVAGMFYPGDADELHRAVQSYLLHAGTPRPVPKALIVPHAGYVYSGPVAGSGYATLESLAKQIRRVVLLGPAHRVYVQGLAASSAARFRSPLGDVALDQQTIRDVVDEFPFVSYVDEAHRLEHSLEVHLPFLQETLAEFVLLPFAVGDARPEWVEALLERLWGGPETLVVISSDLSHYHDYATAQALDRATTDAIETLAPERIGEQHACGRIPICGLLRLARRRGLRAQTLDLRNSGDTAGPRDQVVGYGAYLLHAPTPTLSPEDKRTLSEIARAAIEHGLTSDTPLAIPLEMRGGSVGRPGACFVTLTRHDKLRGCMGSLVPERALIEDVANSARNAAFHDPRFPPLGAAELDGLRIQISVLSEPVSLDAASEEALRAQLRPGVDGVILIEGERRGTFLPSVWATLPTAQEFVGQLKRKAGLPADYWSESIRFERYTTESWSEPIDGF